MTFDLVNRKWTLILVTVADRANRTNFRITSPTKVHMAKKV